MQKRLEHRKGEMLVYRWYLVSQIADKTAGED
jgi:hypothetical protein